MRMVMRKGDKNWTMLFTYTHAHKHKHRHALFFLSFFPIPFLPFCFLSFFLFFVCVCVCVCVCGKRTTTKSQNENIIKLITLNLSTQHVFPIWTYWWDLPRAYCIVLMAAVTFPEFVNRRQLGEHFRLLQPNNWLFARANWNCSQHPARSLGN